MFKQRYAAIAVVCAIVLVVVPVATVSAAPTMQGDPCTFDEMRDAATRQLGIFTLRSSRDAATAREVITAFRLTITAGNLATANSLLGLSSTLDRIGIDAAVKYGANALPTKDGYYLSFDIGSFRNPCGGSGSGGLPAVNPEAVPATGQPDSATADTQALGALAAVVVLVGLLMFSLTRRRPSPQTR